LLRTHLKGHSVFNVDDKGFVFVDCYEDEDEEVDMDGDEDAVTDLNERVSINYIGAMGLALGRPLPSASTRSTVSQSFSRSLDSNLPNCGRVIGGINSSIFLDDSVAAQETKYAE